MILRSEIRKESCERRRNHEEKGKSPEEWKTMDVLRRRNHLTCRDYEERVTYRTITRTEFQKRRASFENTDEKKGGKPEEGKKQTKLQKKARSLEHLTGEDDSDPYHIQFQEREMADKLEDIHRMISDMQEMTRQLKERNVVQNESPDKASVRKMVTSDNGENPIKCNSAVVPVRYKSTIVIVIGSRRQRFKEEIELIVAPNVFHQRT